MIIIMLIIYHKLGPTHPTFDYDMLTAKKWMSANTFISPNDLVSQNGMMIYNVNNKYYVKKFRKVFDDTQLRIEDVRTASSKIQYHLKSCFEKDVDGETTHEMHSETGEIHFIFRIRHKIHN